MQRGRVGGAPAHETGVEPVRIQMEEQITRVPGASDKLAVFDGEPYRQRITAPGYHDRVALTRHGKGSVEITDDLCMEDVQHGVTP